LTDLVFGHSAENLLADIWSNTPVLSELREGLPHRLDGICGDCLMKGICLGSCIAQNYYKTKSMWAPYWFCEEARKRGLFPEARVFQEWIARDDRNYDMDQVPKVLRVKSGST